ncbi:MAG: hypothetical protein EXR93_04765 [Gemmatimonadetes bacterium]|nr:hypothetical protein [Gemmatimonadota bacterium]
MTVRPSDGLAVLIAACTLLGCASRSTSAQQPAPTAIAIADSTQDLPPAGYGTLHQDAVALKLSTDGVQLRVLPLDEQIIRLLAPDSYESLLRLVAGHSTGIDSAAARAGIHRPRTFLVTFFGVGPGARFSPEDVGITSQNQFFRPVAILPLSASWSELRLTQRETASAIYLFEDGITLGQPITLSYGAASTDQWEGTLRTLERERASVYSRSRAGLRP